MRQNHLDLAPKVPLMPCGKARVHNLLAERTPIDASSRTAKFNAMKPRRRLPIPHASLNS